MSPPLYDDGGQICIKYSPFSGLARSGKYVERGSKSHRNMTSLAGIGGSGGESAEI
jgi:hypothetical protein